MNPSKLLIFGSGFISKGIIREARYNNYLIKLLYNSHKVEGCPDLDQRSIAEVDVLSLMRDFRPDFIVCLQGNSFVPDNKNLRSSIDTNVIIPLSALEIILEYVKEGNSIKKIVMAGSAAEYGRSYHEPISEEFPLHPASIYGLTKIFLYNMSIYYKEKGLPIVYARQFNCTGPEQRDSFLLPSLCRQIARIEALKAEPCISIGDLTQERDFIDIRDASRAYLILLENGCPGEVYNIGSGVARSVQQVLDEVLKASFLSEKGVEMRINKSLLFKEQSFSNRIQADIRKLCQLGFLPKMSFKQTVSDTLSYWRSHAI
ncbi:MAG TPA: GDP-mannose 4,6-dehydratase [Candidatus Rifleibacterium sp.]|nr:GDP-mannose 4,6-dehydratase [Candidatus Rifleibacterium sp.]